MDSERISADLQRLLDEGEDIARRSTQEKYMIAFLCGYYEGKIQDIIMKIKLGRYEDEPCEN